MLGLLIHALGANIVPGVYCYSPPQDGHSTLGLPQKQIPHIAWCWIYVNQGEKGSCFVIPREFLWKITKKTCGLHVGISGSFCLLSLMVISSFEAAGHAPHKKKEFVLE